MSRSLAGQVHQCIRIYKMYIIYSCCVDTKAGVAAEVEYGGGGGGHSQVYQDGRDLR